MSPNEFYSLWLYLKDGVPTLDQFPPSVERDQAVMETGGIRWWYRHGLDRIDDHVIIVTPVGYLI